MNKGKNLNMSPSAKNYNWGSVSAPLGTKIPHSAGAGYYYRIQNKPKIAVGCFGDGSASEGDCHAAMNFASTLRSQTLFYCRNNVFAISTPSYEQYGGDGVAARGLALGIRSIKVDGNDLFAVHNAVKDCREYILKEKKPALIEAMTYRVGDHSTSDSSEIYKKNEMKTYTEYLEMLGDPIKRLGAYLKEKKIIENIE